jgi:hypothetical protein
MLSFNHGRGTVKRRSKKMRNPTKTNGAADCRHGEAGARFRCVPNRLMNKETR